MKISTASPSTIPLPAITALLSVPEAVVKRSMLNDTARNPNQVYAILNVVTYTGDRLRFEYAPTAVVGDLMAVACAQLHFTAHVSLFGLVFISHPPLPGTRNPAPSNSTLIYSNLPDS